MFTVLFYFVFYGSAAFLAYDLLKLVRKHTALKDISGFLYIFINAVMYCWLFLVVLRTMAIILIAIYKIFGYL